MAIFTDIMVCETCGTTFHQHKNENGRNYWSCQGNDNLVSEEAMMEFISRRLWIDERTPKNIIQFIESKVEQIKIKNAFDFTVFIKGQEAMKWSPPHWFY